MITIHGSSDDTTQRGKATMPDQHPDTCQCPHCGPCPTCGHGIALRHATRPGSPDYCDDCPGWICQPPAQEKDTK